MRLRRPCAGPVLALVVALAAGLPVRAASAQPFHTGPECWDGPRFYHAGPPDAELAGRLHLIETPATPPSVSMPSAETVSPNGAYRFWVRNPDTTKPRPWGAGIIVDNERKQRLTLLIEDVAQPIAPRWINEKLIQMRVSWGRVAFSDLILDVERAEIIFHERVHDGAIAWRQFQENCGGECPCSGDGAQAPPDPGVMPAATPGEDALIGLVLLPGIFGPPERGGVLPAANPVAVPIYDAPEGGARKLAELEEIDDFEYREYTYEGGAAVVYERRPGWYRIGVRAAMETDRTSAWLSAKSAGALLDLSDLLVGSQAYLNEHWDGYVWTAPEGGMRGGLSKLKRNRDPNAREEYAARVVDVREIGDGVWLQIEMLSGSCSGGAPSVVDSGWVPAYAESGDLVAWLNARGC